MLEGKVTAHRLTKKPPRASLCTTLGRTTFRRRARLLEKLEKKMSVSLINRKVNLHMANFIG